MTQGVIIKGISGVYTVLAENKTYEVTARGRFRNEGITPLVGDRVVLDHEGLAIEEILPRSCEFVRPPIANIDRLVIVASTSEPTIDLRLIDTMLVFAEEQGISAVICINKSDLSKTTDEIANIYKKAGYPTVIASALLGVGIEQLQTLMQGHICALAGNSGVGKSSLINVIDERLSLKTGDLSKIKRGRHTTRSVELIPLLGGGFVADTPGFSRVEPPDISHTKLTGLFPEMAKLLGKCQFVDCSHFSEKGCAIVHAVKQGEIAPSRYEYYKYFYNIMKEVKDWQRKS